VVIVAGLGTTLVGGTRWPTPLANRPRANTTVHLAERLYEYHQAGTPRVWLWWMQDLVGEPLVVNGFGIFAIRSTLGVLRRIYDALPAARRYTFPELRASTVPAVVAVVAAMRDERPVGNVGPVGPTKVLWPHTIAGESHHTESESTTSADVSTANAEGPAWT